MTVRDECVGVRTTNETYSPLVMHWILLVAVIIALLASMYKYVWLQDYYFYVEANCDPSVQECYTRNCDEEECPPRGLTNYRLFLISAKTFQACADNQCSNVCIEGSELCTEVPCDPGGDVQCIGATPAE